MRKLLIYTGWLCAFSTALAQNDCGETGNCFETAARDTCFYKEHMYQWTTDTTDTFIRQGYVVKYNFEYKIPTWAAYHLKEDYLRTPKRKGKYSSFKRDPDVNDGVVTSNYTGSGYSRGHMVPFFASGGDRDGDGELSDYFDDLKDPEDDLTVFQVNYMSNITPQDQDALNGSGGPWYSLETMIRTKLIPDLKELHLVVGSVVSDTCNLNKLVNSKGETDIVIPDKFYQVIIYHDKIAKEYRTLALLFPHVREKSKLPYKNLIDYVVTVDALEAEVGLDFFNGLPDAVEDAVEKSDNLAFWKKWF